MSVQFRKVYCFVMLFYNKALKKCVAVMSDSNPSILEVKGQLITTVTNFALEMPTNAII